VAALFRPAQSRPLHAAAGGLLLAAAFPQPGLAVLAWLVPAWWLFCARGLTSRRAFAVGWAGGLTFNLAALYWLNHIPWPVMPTLGWLVLSAYLALYPALWLALCAAECETRNAESPAPDAIASCSQGVLPNDASWPARALWCLRCAVLWVALEMLMARLLTGFPWLLLANSQHEQLPLIQLASLTGTAGVSFLIVWSSASLLGSVQVLARSRGRPWAGLGEVSLPMLALAGVLAFGLARLLQPAPAGKEITFALIQPSIPQTVKWDQDASQRAFARVLELSRAALALKPDVLVWPEAATPGLLRYNEALHNEVTGLAREHKVWLLLGADDALARADDPNQADYFNSAFLISPEGKVTGKYDKQRLVIFGEYIPLTRWLPFLKWFTPVESGFKPGDAPVQFTLDGLGVRLAPLICFEDVFAFHTRGFIEPDTGLLVNLTNNGWFGESAAQWQHAAMSVYRAVETGRPMVRCTNNGLTCWVDARGRMHEVYFGDSDDIYGAGFKIARLRVTGLGETPPPTFYQRHGDWFGWLCVGLAGGQILFRTLTKWRKR